MGRNIRNFRENVFDEPLKVERKKLITSIQYVRGYYDDSVTGKKEKNKKLSQN